MRNDDSAIDRELQQALDVTPSPEFVARVRMRIAGEPDTSAWRLPWVFAVAVSGAFAIVVVAVLVLRPHQQTSPHVADVALPVAVTPSFSPVISTPESVVVDGRPPAAARSAVARLEHRAPAILVSAAEMRGWRQLLVLANQEDPSLESLLATSPASASIPEIEPDEIVIAPITIEPLASDTQ